MRSQVQVLASTTNALKKLPENVLK